MMRKTAYLADLPDFSGVDPARIVPQLEALITACRQTIERALDEPDCGALCLAQREVESNDALDRYWSVVSHLHAVADNAEFREAYNAGLALLTEHWSWRQQHPRLYAAFKEMRESDGYRRLSNEERRIVDLELRDFHLAGVDLPAPGQERYRELVQRLSSLGARFSQNLMDATLAWRLQIHDAEELAGLPAAELRMLAALARQKGQEGWLVDLSEPSFTAVMTHARDRELRRRVYMAYVTRSSDQGPHAGQWDNSPLIEEMLSLRYRLATLLGFEQYVDYALATRMAESPAEIHSFLVDLADRAKPAAERQLAALERFAAGHGASLPLEAWDIGYWTERFRHHELQLSDEVLKPYFPLGRMLQALFFLAESLFGVRMERHPDARSWHEDVEFYWLCNREGQRFAGIYMDLYARDAKRGGAWMESCRSRRITPEGVQLPIAFLNCNFQRPSAGHPSLLTHNDFRTLFHEAGHCLHHLLTTVDWPQINGIHNVEWDAVELASQLLEYWCWNEEILGRFACHYQTGEPLPAQLKERLLRARHFQKAMLLVRQIEYAMSDLRLHSEYDPAHPPQPLRVIDEVRRRFAVVQPPPENRFLNSFSHIFGGGYSAGYYSYLWAELLAADAWGRFRAEGAFDPKAGAAFRDEILAVGASRPAMDSFIAFRDRKPEPGPLLESYGLGADDQAARRAEA